jgi:phage tail-like protein
MFSVNSHRIDPYKNFKFQVVWDNEPVAGLSKMSALKRTTEVIEWRAAGDSSIVRKLPGRTKYEPITLEAGLSHDQKFMEWADRVNHPQGDAAASLVNYRQDIVLNVLNLQATVAMSFKLSRCWVSEFQALPEMDANANAVAIQTLKFEFEGFELDPAVSEPTES